MKPVVDARENELNLVQNGDGVYGKDMLHVLRRGPLGARDDPQARIHSIGQLRRKDERRADAAEQAPLADAVGNHVHAPASGARREKGLDRTQRRKTCIRDLEGAQLFARRVVVRNPCRLGGRRHRVGQGIEQRLTGEHGSDLTQYEPSQRRRSARPPVPQRATDSLLQTHCVLSKNWTFNLIVYRFITSSGAERIAAVQSRAN